MKGFKRTIGILVLVVSCLFLMASSCEDSQDERDQKAANRQSSTYAKRQPVPAYGWSLERELVIQLYNLRNQRVSTHSIWRSDTGVYGGDCPSMGYGIPYDTSLTNPLKPTTTNWRDAPVVEQQEPNGIFLSKNTNATWVICTGPGGTLDPIYVEEKVAVYPYPIKVKIMKNGVAIARKAGKSKVKFQVGKKKM